jgi:hypothetical protein
MRMIPGNVPSKKRDIRSIGPCRGGVRVWAKIGFEFLMGEVGMTGRSWGPLFYGYVLPLAVAVNLALGITVLGQLRPTGWLGGLEVTTGALCCAIAGWLAAAAWSRAYWGRAMVRQITAWHQMVDAIFAWMEETPPPADALLRLKGSLDDVLPQPGSTST